MSFAWFRAMLRLTLTKPREAGALVVEMGWPMQGLWIALMLVSVLLSLLVSAVFYVAPLPPGEMGELIQLSPAYHTPLLFALLNWAQALIGIGTARVLLTLAYIVTRNLWVSAGAHVLNDWTGFLFAFAVGHAPIGTTA